MRKILAGVCIAAVAVGLSGCGYKADHGNIIEKTYSAEESGYHFIPQTQCHYNSSTKSTQCVTNQVYTYFHNPECYRIRIEDDKEHRGSYCIRGEQWNELEVGDYVDTREN